MGKEESSEVEELGPLDDLLDLRSIEVRRCEFLSRAELGAKRAVVAGEDDGACAGLRVRAELVERGEPFLVVGSAELVG